MAAAAAAGGGGAAVSVLAPSGRRVTVRVGPGTVLLQVPEEHVGSLVAVEVCQTAQQCQAGDGASLRESGHRQHGAKSAFGNRRAQRAAGESGARTAYPWWEVRIALQLDNGSRLQDTFFCQQTLWELLSRFAEIRQFMEQHGEFSPVCVYMRDEISGKAALEKTTLRSLGLTGGSAIIRVVMKKCPSPGGEEAAGAAEQRDEPAASRGPAEGAADVPLPPANAFPQDSGHGDVAVSLNSCTDEQDLAKKSHGGLEELRPSSRPESAPFIPFSGDGQRLGSSAVADGLDTPSSKLPTTFSSPGGPSKPKKSKNSQELQKEQEQLVEREPLVCHPDLLEPLPAGPEELPDEFFEVTVDDVRKRLAQLQSERQRLEEAPLMTKSWREAQLKEKLERYPKVVLRVHFPDRHVLQGFFRPSETVGVLRDFVRAHLADADLPFYLFIAPPRVILNNESLTLFEAKLFPTAVVHFGSEQCRDCYLKSDLLSSAVSPSAADLLAARCLSTSVVPPASPSVESAVPSLSGPELGRDGGTEEEAEPAGARAAPRVPRGVPGKVPKWLKLPGGKR
ncbi:tether containing UBX domain for GLUT4 isoform X1 [Columba livia]|uniref:tether containing UBX domain for GLUT4 isoform X1 n=1 Tax=Columba livia TaxID=8932 RepID=UPI0031BA20D7